MDNKKNKEQEKNMKEEESDKEQKNDIKQENGKEEEKECPDRLTKCWQKINQVHSYLQKKYERNEIPPAINIQTVKAGVEQPFFMVELGQSAFLGGLLEFKISAIIPDLMSRTVVPLLPLVNGQPHKHLTRDFVSTYDQEISDGINRLYDRYIKGRDKENSISNEKASASASDKEDDARDEKASGEVRPKLDCHSFGAQSYTFYKPGTSKGTGDGSGGERIAHASISHLNNEIFEVHINHILYDRKYVEQVINKEWICQGGVKKFFYPEDKGYKCCARDLYQRVYVRAAYNRFGPGGRIHLSASQHPGIMGEWQEMIEEKREGKKS